MSISTDRLHLPEPRRSSKKEIFESFKLQERRDVSYYFPEDYTKEKHTR